MVSDGAVSLIVEEHFLEAEETVVGCEIAGWFVLEVATRVVN